MVHEDVQCHEAKADECSEMGREHQEQRDKKKKRKRKEMKKGSLLRN